MGIAALVLGIISIVISFVPVIGIVAFLPALIGVVLGTIDVIIRVKSKLKKGVSVTGLILSFLSILIMVMWFVVGFFMLKSGMFEQELKSLGDKLQTEIQNDNN